MKLIITSIILAFVTASCATDKIDRKAFVENEITKKLQQYRSDQVNDCYEDMLEEINFEVDSMMYFLVQKMQGNSDEMPARPARPERLVDTISLDERPTGK